MDTIVITGMASISRRFQVSSLRSTFVCREPKWELDESENPRSAHSGHLWQLSFLDLGDLTKAKESPRLPNI